MPIQILNGAAVAERIKNEVLSEVGKFQASRRKVPCLAAVRVGEDPASAVYVGNKVKTSKQLGLLSEHHHLPASASHDDLLKIVNELNANDGVDGILVQLPLPKQIRAEEILDAIDPRKDVDGFHPINVGRLAQGRPYLVPCTPAGVIEILRYYKIEMRGKNVCVLGRSNIVGKPMAQLLLLEDATVTIAHSRTRNLAEVASAADILIVAIGKVGFVRGEHIKENATVIDVGISQVFDEQTVRENFDGEELERRLNVLKSRGSTLIGDVNWKEISAKAARATPVPGGVGLLTVAMLMKNTVRAARLRRGV